MQGFIETTIHFDFQILVISFLEKFLSSKLHSIVTARIYIDI